MADTPAPMTAENITLAVALAKTSERVGTKTLGDDSVQLLRRALLHQTAELEACRRRVAELTEEVKAVTDDLASYMGIANTEANDCDAAEQRAEALAARLAQVEAVLAEYNAALTESEPVLCDSCKDLGWCPADLTEKPRPCRTQEDQQ